jgi:hypothetical protein
VVSEFPAGLTRQTIESIMSSDPKVISFSRANESGSMWQATVAVDGGEPVDLIVDNGINPIYLQALARLDYEGVTPDERALLIDSAIKSLGPYATVGLAELGGGIYLRSAFFMDHCNMHAFTNTLQGIVLAHAAYVRQLSVPSV